MALIALGALFGVMTAFGHLADRLSAGYQPSSRFASKVVPPPISPFDIRDIATHNRGYGSRGIAKPNGSAVAAIRPYRLGVGSVCPCDLI